MALQFNNQTIQRHFDKLSYVYLFIIYLFIYSGVSPWGRKTDENRLDSHEMTFRCAGRTMGGLKVRRWSKSNRCVILMILIILMILTFFLRWSYVISNWQISVTWECVFCFFDDFGWLVATKNGMMIQPGSWPPTSDWIAGGFLASTAQKGLRNSQEQMNSARNRHTCTHLSFGWDLDQESHNQTAIMCIRIHRYAQNLLRTCPLNWLIHLK